MGVLTLKGMCLREIVDSFDRFNQAFNLGTADLKRSFEFLQRVYSQEILNMLFKTDKFKDEFLNFLINPYLKELDLQMIYCDWEFISGNLVKFGYGIQKLVMSDYYANELLSSAHVMNYMPNIKILHLHHICTDDNLIILSKCCPNLTELEINDSLEVTNEGIKSLFAKDENGMFAHSMLEVLHLEGTKVNDEAITFLLENIPSLKVLCHLNLPRVLLSMHKKDLDKNTLSKAKAYNLTELDVKRFAQSPSFHDILLICIKVCPYIKNLHLLIMKQEDIDLCCKFTGLQNVHLESFAKEHTADVDNFLKVRGSSLTTLKLHGFSLSLSVLAQYCPRLTTLKLSNIAFQPKKSGIPSFRNLQEFILVHADFSDSDTIEIAISILSSSPMLEKLSFVHCEHFNLELNCEILKCCTQCSLKYVDFTDSDVDFNLLQNILFSCKTLEFFAVDSCMFAENMQFLCDIASTIRNRPQISLEYCGGYYSGDIYDDFESSDDYETEYVDNYHDYDVDYEGNIPYPFDI